MMLSKRRWMLLLLCLLVLMLQACEPPPTHPDTRREDRIPADAVKRTPATDHHPPVMHSDEYEDPVPVPGLLNSAGLEDSPFILPDGKTMYFFFTPNAEMNWQEQLLDEVTGIWVSYLVEGLWTEPERVWLEQPGKLALDGCVAIQDDEMWFCSAREGYTGVQMFTARWQDDAWIDITYVGDLLMQDYQIGESHLHGDDLYFHSDREGGQGGSDIWMTSRSDGTWSEPVNIEAINTAENEGMPFVSVDGSALWFNRTYMGTPGLFRSLWEEDGWGEPELMVSMFAGEPTLDAAGNIYFIHHFYEHDVMIEADIYVAYKKQSGNHEETSSTGIEPLNQDRVMMPGKALVRPVKKTKDI